VAQVLQRLLVSEATGSDYIGEPVCKASHMVQAAQTALARREPEEVILACLFHDIGHLLAPDDTGGNGVANHAALGAGLLRGLGVSNRTCDAVGQHVNAKRYCVGSDPFYELTPSSVVTLGFQGGPMTSAPERYAFRSHPAFGDAMIVRGIDETAKTDSLSRAEVSEAFNGFAPMIARHVSE
jgi:putative nucleotidyltransferase with HDIG domain